MKVYNNLNAFVEVGPFVEDNSDNKILLPLNRGCGDFTPLPLIPIYQKKYAFEFNQF
jgi:hypothetical protein